MGRQTWSDGSWYEGQWGNDNMKGHGRYEWPDGRKYIGQYLYNKK